MLTELHEQSEGCLSADMVVTETKMAESQPF